MSSNKLELKIIEFISVFHFFCLSSQVENFINQYKLDKDQFLHQLINNHNIIILNDLNLNIDINNLDMNIFNTLIIEKQFTVVKKKLNQLGFDKEYLKDKFRILIQDLKTKKELEHNEYQEYNFKFDNKSSVLLTKSEEQKLFKQLKDTNDPTIRAKIFARNLKLIFAIAKKYQNRGLPLSDLIYMGIFGLEKAINKFDYTKGFRFSTYAFCWIVQSITRSLADLGKIMRIPVHWTELQYKVIKFTNKFINENFLLPTNEEIAEGLKVKVKKIQNLKQLKSITLNLDQSIHFQQDNKSNKSLNDIMVTSDMSFFEKKALEDNLVFLFNLIDTFPPLEKEILLARFSPKYTQEKNIIYEQIITKFNITKEEIKIIERKCLQKLLKLFKKQL